MTERCSWTNRLLLTATVAGLLAAGLAPAPATAAEREIYVGFHLGRAGVDLDRGTAFDQVLDSDENSVSYEVGYRWSSFLAVELGHHDLSKVDGVIRPCAEGVPCSDIAIEGEVTAWSLAFVPHYELTGRVRLFAKLGIVSWESSAQAVAENLDVTLVDVDDEDVIYGAGVEIRLLGQLKGVARFESIAGDIDSVSVGVRISF